MGDPGAVPPRPPRTRQHALGNRCRERSAGRVLSRSPFGDPRLEVTALAWAPVGALVCSRHRRSDADSISSAGLAEHAVLRPPPHAALPGVAD